MKKLIYLAIILVGMGIVSSCTKEGSGQDALIGTWKLVQTNVGAYDVGDVWKFEKNGAISVNGLVMGQYRYDIDAQKIIVSTAEEGVTGEAWVVSLSSTTLILRIYYDNAQANLEFTKVNLK